MASSNRVNVQVESHFPEYKVKALEEIGLALAIASAKAAERAKSEEVPERTGSLRGSIGPIPIERQGTHFISGVGAGTFYANFIEKGTRRKFTGKNSKGQSAKVHRAASSGKGNKAWHFLQKGCYSVRGSLLEDIRNRLERIG